MNKEEFYDTKIAPLMAEIIAACREGGIAMVASYAIPIEDEDRGDLRCTTHLPDGDEKFDERCSRAAVILRTGHEPGTVFRITEKLADGNTRITAIV